MYINCIFSEYYQTVISNMLVCIPVVMLNDNYMRRSMENKKTSRISTTCQLVEKVYFYKNRAKSLSLTPNPFPVGRGYITGATAPRPCRGLRPCDPFLSTIEVFRQIDKPYFYDSQNLRSQKDKAMALRLNRENENRSVT